MALFLQVLGVIFLVLVILLVILLLLARNQLKKSGHPLFSEKHPDRIHLKEYFDPEWTEYDEFEDIFELLFQYGFAQGRSYTVNEMPDVRLATFFHEKNRACCVVHDDDHKGIWAEFIVYYEDGEELSFSNDPQGQDMDYRPDVNRFYFPKVSFKSLFRKFRKGSKIKPMISISNINFKEIYEESYKKDREWANKHTRIGKDEKFRIPQNMEDDDFDDDFIEDEDDDEEYTLYDECMDEFIRNTSMSVAQWEKYQDEGDFLIVSDKFDPEDFAEYICDYVDLSDKQERLVIAAAKKSSSNKQVFNVINQSFSPNRKAKKIEQYSKPVEFEVYWFPM